MTNTKNKIIIVIAVILVSMFAFFIFGDANARKIKKMEKIKLDDITVYNESINVDYSNSKEHTIDLVKSDDLKEKTTYQTTENADEGIEASEIENGKYYLADGEKYLTSPDQFETIEFYTLTRDNVNQHIVISYNHQADAIMLSKEDAELPAEVYDIVIDPGHGGDDTGSIGVDGTTLEKDMALMISQKLKTDLEEMGYKVKMTRESDENPGNIANLEEYGEGSRIGIPYESQAKLFISMHYNTGGGSGYEVYSSVNTSNQFVSEIQNAINESLDRSQKVNYCEQGNCKVPLTYETLDSNDDDVDYFFAVREVGGRSIPTFSEKNIYRENTTGAEGIILESGYIDNLEELKYLNDEETMEKITAELSTAIDKYIKEQ